MKKKVFITGGTSGLGKSIAKIYSRRGYIVGVCGRSSEKFHFSELEFHDNIYFFRADIAQKDEIKKAVEDFQKKFGPIDYLYANAGIGVSKKSYSPNFIEERAVVDVNVLGFMNTIEVVLPKMVERKSGHIVGISSLAAIIGLPRNGAYCASKAFVKTYCESLAITLKKSKVQVSCILPGYIKTPHTKGNNHPMPFIVHVGQAAQKIIGAVDAKKEFFCFPKSFMFVTLFARILPRKVLYWGLSKIKFN